MRSDFEATLVSHCAATLAGHKCASLFCYHGYIVDESEIEQLNKLLSPKGVRIRTLKRCENGVMVYVYRPSRLSALLAQSDVQAFLQEYGYPRASLEQMLRILSSRLTCDSSFPHEIGVFLDYPLADVIGFIENRGTNCCYAGCWKAYGNECEARRRFTLYRKCKTVYQECYQKGLGLSRLTVSA